MKIIILITSLFIFNSTIAQIEYFEDSIEVRTFFPQKYGHKKWKFLFGFDAHRSFYSGTPVKFNGIRIGAEFRGVHRFGLGLYFPKKNIEFTDIDVNYPDAAENAVLRLDISFTTLFYERVLFKNKHWEFSIPSNFGGGTVKAIYQDSLGKFQNIIDRPFSTLGFGAQAKYYIWGWLVPHVSIGYRFTFNADQEIKQAFNSPYYAFGISIGIGDLYKKIFKNNEVGHVIKTKIDEGAVEEGDLEE